MRTPNPPRRTPALLAVLLVSALLAAGSALVGAPAARAAGGVVITLGGVSPAALDPDHDLVVRGSVRNTGSAPVEDAGVRLRLHTGVLASRDAITRWLDDGTSGGSRTLPGDADLKTLAPNSTRSFTLTVPRGRTGLSGGAWSFGPRALEVVATGGGDEIGRLRTTVVWSPAPDDAPVTRLSLLAPITAATTAADAGAPDRRNADLYMAGGRLERVLSAASEPGFDWAVDPAALAAAARIAAGGVVDQPDAPAPDGGAATGQPSAPPAPTTTGTTTGTGTPAPTATGTDAQERRAAGQWIDRITDGRSDRSVLGLPYADPDLNSLLNNGRADLLQVADSLGRQVTTRVLGTPLDTSVAWPGDGRVAGPTIAGLGRAGRTDVVLAAGSQPPDPPVDFTATGRSTMRSHHHTVHGLLYDEDLSSLLDDATGADPATGTQTLLAELAAIGREAPDRPRHVLAVAPRTWDPDPRAAKVLLTTLRAVPWVDLRGLDELRTQDVSTVKRSRPEYGAADRRAQLPAGQLTAIARLNSGLNQLAPALVDRDTVLPPLQERLASLTSFSWRGETDALSTARLDVARIITPVTGGVDLLTGAQNRLVPGKSLSIPVFVQNSSPYAIRVEVRLRPRTGQLRIKEAVTVEVPSGSRGSQVLVPADALADGNVEVEAGLYATNGQQIGTTEVFRLRVRPNWETRAMVGAAAVLGLLLVFGLLRSFLRDRTRVPPEAVPDVDDLASRRADVLRPNGPPQGSSPSTGAGDEHGESSRDGTSQHPHRHQDDETPGTDPRSTTPAGNPEPLRESR